MNSTGQLFAILCAFVFGICGARSAGVAAIKEQTYHRDCELLDQLREVGIVSADFQRLREQRVVLILGAAARAVGARHFTEAELLPAETDPSLASVREPVVGGSGSMP